MNCRVYMTEWRTNRSYWSKQQITWHSDQLPLYNWSVVSILARLAKYFSLSVSCRNERPVTGGGQYKYCGEVYTVPAAAVLLLTLHCSSSGSYRLSTEQWALRLCVCLRVAPWLWLLCAVSERLTNTSQMLTSAARSTVPPLYEQTYLPAYLLGINDWTVTNRR